MSQQPHQHDPLSSLATLVSATIRDKVVLDQMEELSRLKSQLESTRRVEITGPGGSPLLAHGNFAHGEFGEGYNEDGSVGTVWDVGLTTVNTEGVPMHQLASVEIRIGGIVYTTSDDIDGTKIALGIRTGNCFDTTNHDGSIRRGGMSRSAVCEFDRRAFFTFHMTDFPSEDWRSLRSLNMHNRSIAIRNEEREELGLDYDDEDDELNSEAMDIYSYITERLALEHEGQKVEISSVSFCLGGVGDSIWSLWRGLEFEKEKERYLKKADAGADR